VTQNIAPQTRLRALAQLVREDTAHWRKTISEAGLDR
jgi:hypothetical protein